MTPRDDLDAMLEARLAALARRAGGDDDVSFASDDEPDPRIEELWQMVDQARRGGEAVSFGLEGLEQREPASLVQRMLQRLTHPIFIDTPAERTRLRTYVGWTGDTTTLVTLDRSTAPSAGQIAAHTTALEASLVTNLRRLRVLSLIMTAAAKIAAMIANPGAASMALPIAYECVRDLYEQWTTASADSTARGTPWQ